MALLVIGASGPLKIRQFFQICSPSSANDWFDAYVPLRRRSYIILTHMGRLTLELYVGKSIALTGGTNNKSRLAWLNWSAVRI